MSGEDESAAAASTAPLSAVLPHLIVAQHLRAHGFHDTLAAFEADAARAGIVLPDLKQAEADVASSKNSSAALSLVPADLELPNLLSAYTTHQRALAAEAAARAAKEALRESLLTDKARLLELSLPGPSTLPFVLHATFRTLHASNILSIRLIQLPVRRFSTATARFETSLQPALASTAADRRVVISDPETGDMVEVLEGAQGSAQGHRAAVLSTAQNPLLPRELVSTSMDSTVLVWDLLAGGGSPVQLLKDHSRFVVHSAYSADGRFLATAGYDRKIHIYQREPLPQSAPSSAQASEQQDEDDPEPTPIKSPFKLVHSVDTKGGNPEAILFVETALLPLPETDGIGESDQPMQAGLTTDRPRTWLAFSCRGECHLNYLAIPRTGLEASNGHPGVVAALSQQLQSLDVKTTNGDDIVVPVDEPKDWTLVKCNTNENADDWHVSYSLLCLAAHPGGKFISAQTGDHARPSSTTMTGETILPPPRILILQPLRPGRVHTLFLPPAHSSAAALGGGSSLSPAPRHVWLQPQGQALWVAGEDGRVRLLDLQTSGGEGSNARLRAEVWTQGRPDDADEAGGLDSSSRVRLQDAEQEASAMWSRGGNTVIKDICVLDSEGSLATVGFDHTVRIVRRRKD